VTRRKVRQIINNLWIRISRHNIALLSYLRRKKLLFGSFLTGSKLIFGENILIEKGVNISLDRDATMTVGNNTVFRYNSVVVIKKGAHFKIGNNCSVNHHSSIGSMSSVSIGNNCMIAPFVTILDWSHKFSNLNISKREQGFSVGEVHIGEDVWIGTHVSIFKGVTIGDRAIVGANCVIRNNVLPQNILVTQEAIVQSVIGEKND